MTSPRPFGSKAPLFAPCGEDVRLFKVVGVHIGHATVDLVVSEARLRKFLDLGVLIARKAKLVWY